MRLLCTRSVHYLPVHLWATVVAAWVLSSTGFAGQSTGDEISSTSDDRWVGHTLGYHLAVDNTQVRDDLLVPMRFSGVGGALGVGWGYATTRLRCRADAGLAMAYVMERMGNPGATLALWLVAEGYYRRLHQWGNLALDLGAIWRSRITNALLYSWDDTHLYYLASHVLGPAISLSWRGLKRSTVLMTLRLPFFGVAGRPPEERFVKQEYVDAHFLFVKPHENLRLAFVPEYRSVDISLGVAWMCGRSRFEIRYSLDYEREDEPQPFRNLVHRVAFIQDIGLGGMP